MFLLVLIIMSYERDDDDGRIKNGRCSFRVEFNSSQIISFFSQICLIHSVANHSFSKFAVLNSSQIISLLSKIRRVHTIRNIKNKSSVTGITLQNEDITKNCPKSSKLESEFF